MKKGQWAIGSEDYPGVLCYTFLSSDTVFSNDFEDGGYYSGRVLLFETEYEATVYILANQLWESYPLEFDYYLHF